MPGRQCYHCKQWVEQGEAHDCWTTTEAALLAHASDDLRDAWERLRETATEFGEQRIYASHKSIMFSRKSCYFFVRPKTKHLELVMFLGRPVKAPQINRVEPASKAKLAHTIHVRHRDEVEPPITDWLREAYDFAAVPAETPKAYLENAIDRYAADVAATARAGLKALRARFPGARLLVFDRRQSLAIGLAPAARGNPVFSIVLYPRWVRLFFLEGAVLDDAKGRLEGTGNQVRSIRLSAGAPELADPYIRKLMMQALKEARANLKSGAGEVEIRTKLGGTS